MRPRRQRDTVIRPTPQQQQRIRREGGILFTKKYDRNAPTDSQESTTTSSNELPSLRSAPSGPESSDSSNQSQPSADGGTIMVQLSEYTSSDDAVRRSSRPKTPSRRAAGL
jgi:hypothetical protein